MFWKVLIYQEIYSNFNKSNHFKWQILLIELEIEITIIFFEMNDI